MKIKKTIFIFCFLFFSTAFSETKPVLTILHWDLPNHTRVFFVPRHELPILDVEWIVDAGSVRDGNTPGIAALTNSLLGTGAKDLSLSQISDRFENVGAQFQPFSNRDNAGVVLRTLTDPKKLSESVNLLHAIIATPTFPENEMARLKQQAMVVLKMQQEDTWQTASNQFYKTLYGNFPYAHNPLGNENSVSALTQTQLIQFYQSHYTGSNANLILVGDLTEAQAREIALQLVGNTPAGTVLPRLSDVAPLQKATQIKIPFHATQSTLIIGQVGMSRNDPDYFPLVVGNAIFGGMTPSWLYDTIREKNGLAYVAMSDFSLLRYRGPFVIALQTKNNALTKSETMANQLLVKFINQGPTDAQLARAKQYLIGAFPLTFSSNKNILSVVANIAFYHRPLDYLDTYEQNISLVTREQIKNAFQKKIQPGRMVSVVVG